MSIAQLVFGLLTVASIAYTVVGYPRRYGALSGRSRLFRFAGLGLLNLLLILVVIFLSTTFVGRVGAFQRLAFFASFMGLGFSLVCIALLDALESYSVLRREERAAVQKAIEEMLPQKNTQ